MNAHWHNTSTTRADHSIACAYLCVDLRMADAQGGLVINMMNMFAPKTVHTSAQQDGGSGG